MKKILTRNNILNGIIGALLLVLLLVPSAKALVIEGLMQIGLFKPATSHQADDNIPATDLSDLRFRDASGKVVAIGDLKGKVVFINFWASWCPPCLAEMPSIHKMYEKFKDNSSFVFIFVDADGDLLKAKKFMDKRRYGLPVYDVASEIPEAVFSGSLPTTVVLDKQGRVSYNESGAANYNDNKFIAFMTKLSTMN